MKIKAQTNFTSIVFFLFISFWLIPSHAVLSNRCSGVLELEKAERAILQRLDFVNENKKVELIALTSDLKIFKIPYDHNVAHLRLKPWLVEVETSKAATTKSIVNSITRNQLLLVTNKNSGEKFLLVGLHKETSRIFDIQESYIPLKIYLQDLREAIDFFARSLKGTGGLQGPSALLHLWILRTTLKIEDAQKLIHEELPWEQWKEYLSTNYDHIYTSIRDHAFTGRYDLREDFYNTFDQITEQLAIQNDIPLPAYSKYFFEKQFTQLEERSLRIATWNLNGFYLGRMRGQIEEGIGSRKSELLSYKSKSEVKQILRNIELVKPDALLLTEVEINSISDFAKKELAEKYSVHAMRGNDPFAKDIALLVKNDLPVKVKVESHSGELSQERLTDGQPIFSRDLPIFYLHDKTNGKLKLVLVGVHFKALRKNYGNNSSTINIQNIEIHAATEIVQDLRKKYGNKVFLMGDFNTNLRSPSGVLKNMISSNSLFNPLPEQPNAYSIISRSTSLTEIMAKIREVHKTLPEKEIRAIAKIQYDRDRYVRQGLIDGIFIPSSIELWIRKTFVHRLVDRFGVVLTDQQSELRASDHNMVAMDIDMAFLKELEQN